MSGKDTDDKTKKVKEYLKSKKNNKSGTTRNASATP
jgi:hypothetical protein